jgi:hypothetical protein
MPTRSVVDPCTSTSRNGAQIRSLDCFDAGRFSIRGDPAYNATEILPGIGNPP